MLLPPPFCRFQINEVRLAHFLCRVEEGYRDNPYHCRIHAADVLRNLYVVMQRGGVLKSAFPETMDLSLLSSFFAAIVHDFDHRCGWMVIGVDVMRAVAQRLQGGMGGG